VLRQGPISPFFHGVIEYVAAAVFVAAPFVLSFDSGTAKAVSIVVGVVILVITASSELPTGLAKTIPVVIHATLDFVLAVILIASPFLFGFTDDGNATAFFIILGIVHLLVTIATRFLPPRAAVAEGDRPGR
jgi:hypothetical protein